MVLGKTTFACFIKAILYGFKDTRKKDVKENERVKYKPWNNKNYGGNLVIEYEGSKYKIERFFGKTQKEDDFLVINLETNKIEKRFSENIGEDIFKLDRDSFEKSIYIGQQSVEVKTSDDLRTKLTNLDTIQEDDINKYKEAIKRIDDSIAKIKKKGKIMVEERNQLQSNVDEDVCLAENYNIQADNLKDLENQKEVNLKEIEEIEDKIRIYNEFEVKEEKRKRYEFLKITKEEKEQERDLVLKHLDNELLNEKNLVNLDKEMDYQEQRIKRNKEIKKQLNNLNMLEQFKKAENDKIEVKQTRTNNKTFLKFIPFSLLFILGIFFINEIGSILIIVGLVIVYLQIKANNKEKREIQKLKDQKESIKKELEGIQNDIMSKNEELENNNSVIYDFVKKYIKNDFHVDIDDEVFLQELRFERISWEKCNKELNKIENEIKEFEQENDLDILNMKEDTPEKRADLEVRLQNLKRKREIILHNLILKEKEIHVFESKIEESGENQIYLQNKKEELSKGLEYYDRLEKVKMLLEEAKENISAKYLSKMNDGVKKYLDKISENDDILQNVSINTDLEVTMDVDGKSKELDYYSMGYKDLIGIATRFCLIDAIFEKENPFIILDDPFVNLDKDKIENANNLIKEASKKYQIIYFTCHESRKVK